MADVEMSSPPREQQLLPHQKKLNVLNDVYKCFDKNCAPLDDMYTQVQVGLETVEQLKRHQFSARQAEVLESVEKQIKVIMDRRNQLVQDHRLVIHHLFTLALQIDRCHALEF